MKRGSLLLLTKTEYSTVWLYYTVFNHFLNMYLVFPFFSIMNNYAIISLHLCHYIHNRYNYWVNSFCWVQRCKLKVLVCLYLFIEVSTIYTPISNIKVSVFLCCSCVRFSCTHANSVCQTF
jgi:hypothetical protein